MSIKLEHVWYEDFKLEDVLFKEAMNIKLEDVRNS